MNKKRDVKANRVIDLLIAAISSFQSINELRHTNTMGHRLYVLQGNVKKIYALTYSNAETLPVLKNKLPYFKIAY